MTSQGLKLGFNNAITSGNFVTLSNAATVNPAGEQVRIVSTSANDSSTGTGIQKLLITYFDNTWTLNTEVVSTNGTTPVFSVATNIFRIEDFEAFQVGTGQFSAGTITMTNLAATSLFAQIDPTYTKFFRALHYVAPGKVANIIDVTANCPTTSGVVFNVFITKDNTLLGGNLIMTPYVAFLLSNNTVHMSLGTQATLNYPIVCDATNSTVGLQMGIAVKGIGGSQIGIATFHYVED